MIFIFYQNFANSFEKIVWKDKGFNTTDNYIQEFYKGSTKVRIDGELKEFNLTFLKTFPNQKYNKKNWECRPWIISEMNTDNKNIYKIYTLNDCLPCLDKGGGYLCSYPYFIMESKTRLYDEILLEKIDKRLSQINDDGIIHNKISVNLSSRERVEIVERRINGKYRLGSRLVKYNTKYRQIPSQGFESKSVVRDIGSAIVFNSLLKDLKNDVKLAIETKNKLVIREKDINTILQIEPSAQKFKFQTRD